VRTSLAQVLNSFRNGVNGKDEGLRQRNRLGSPRGDQLLRALKRR
jgi:hypothetical protein